MRDAQDRSTPSIDLSLPTEATRRALYDAVVAVHFSATREDIQEALREEEWIETHTAEEAGVVIHYLCGRWFTVWRMLAEPADAPERQRWEVLTVHEDPGKPYGIGFSEV